MRNLPVHRKLLWALSGAGAVGTYLGWLYVAYVASRHIQELAYPVPFLPLLRQDTFGAVCGLASVAAFMICVFIWPSKSSWAVRSLRAGSLAGIVYGSSGWYYISQNAMYHPVTLRRQLTHFLSFPDERTFGAVCGATAIVSSLVLLGLAAVLSINKGRSKTPNRP